MCGGRGTVDEFRCPAMRAPNVEGFLDAYVLLVGHDLWPVAGGVMDQAAWMVDAVRVADGERAWLQEQESQPVVLDASKLPD